MVPETSSPDFSALLREHGFRATKNRTALLSFLERAATPLSVQKILTQWADSPDQATLYRTLTDLASAGIVRRADFNTGVAQFEFTPHKPHHHHIVCTDCGRVEDVNTCALGRAQEAVQSQSKLFRSISSHMLEFYGRCASCV